MENNQQSKEKNLKNEKKKKPVNYALPKDIVSKICNYTKLFKQRTLIKLGDNTYIDASQNNKIQMATYEIKKY